MIRYLFLILFVLFLVTGVLCSSSNSPSSDTAWKLDNNGDTLYWEGCIGGWSYTNPTAETNQ